LPSRAEPLLFIIHSDVEGQTFSLSAVAGDGRSDPSVHVLGISRETSQDLWQPGSHYRLELGLGHDIRAIHYLIIGSKVLELIKVTDCQDIIR